MLAAADQTVKTWQRKSALAETNEVVQPEDWAAQAEAPNSSLIVRAQTLLNELGYDAGPSNGQLGEQTRDAVKSLELGTASRRPPRFPSRLSPSSSG